MTRVSAHNDSETMDERCPSLRGHDRLLTGMSGPGDVSQGHVNGTIVVQQTTWRKGGTAPGGVGGRCYAPAYANWRSIWSDAGGAPAWHSERTWGSSPKAPLCASRPHHTHPRASWL